MVGMVLPMNNSQEVLRDDLRSSLSKMIGRVEELIGGPVSACQTLLAIAIQLKQARALLGGRDPVKAVTPEELVKAMELCFAVPVRCFEDQIYTKDETEGWYQTSFEHALEAFVTLPSSLEGEDAYEKWCQFTDKFSEAVTDDLVIRRFTDKLAAELS